MLVGTNLVKSYGDTTILKGVNITIEPGKITTIIGPSGSGKTTLLKALSLLEYPDSGTVQIDDLSYTFSSHLGSNHLNSSYTKQIKSPPWPKVTVVFQQLFLWPHLTLRQNILLPLQKLVNQDHTYLDSLIQLFEMKDFIDRYPNEASLGQRQRVALVRALVLNPKYILLDEITSSLDVEQVAIILAELKTLRDKGIGMLAITHLMNFAKDMADQIVFMESGEILEAGGKEILDHPKNERVGKFLSVIEAAR